MVKRTGILCQNLIIRICNNTLQRSHGIHLNISGCEKLGKFGKKMRFDFEFWTFLWNVRLLKKN